MVGAVQQFSVKHFSLLAAVPVFAGASGESFAAAPAHSKR